MNKKTQPNPLLIVIGFLTMIEAGIISAQNPTLINITISTAMGIFGGMLIKVGL